MAAAKMSDKAANFPSDVTVTDSVTGTAKKVTAGQPF